MTSRITRGLSIETKKALAMLAIVSATSFSLSIRSLLDTSLIGPRQMMSDTGDSGKDSSDRPNIHLDMTERDSKKDEELPYISTIRETMFERPKDDDLREAKNFYELLVEREEAPLLSSECQECYHSRNCYRNPDLCAQYCSSVCYNYTENLCPKANEILPQTKKFVSKELVIVPPSSLRDPTRLVPRIVHQTWFEKVTEKDYPNMSRVTNSWKHSGWDYRFYTDADSIEFLKMHFPNEILETYETLIPGAFKADLFRYCVLLIRGGVYADVDVLLESNLDAIVEPDIGFMVPHGTPKGCNWQGIIVAAPGHPFLAAAIEMIVNQVRNKHTSVDVAANLCPETNHALAHYRDILFVTGPCLLGVAINKELGRPYHTNFPPGEFVHHSNPNKAPSATNLTIVRTAGGGSTFTRGYYPKDGKSSSETIPGRTVILKLLKRNDLGADRLTYVQKNLIMAATGLRDSYDSYRKDVNDKDGGAKKQHAYENSRGKETYGLKGVYTHSNVAREDIRIKVSS